MIICMKHLLGSPAYCSSVWSTSLTSNESEPPSRFDFDFCMWKHRVLGLMCAPLTHATTVAPPHDSRTFMRPLAVTGHAHYFQEGPFRA